MTADDRASWRRSGASRGAEVVGTPVVTLAGGSRWSWPRPGPGRLHFSELPTIFPSLFGHVSPRVSAAASLSSLPASSAFISPTSSLRSARLCPCPSPSPRGCSAEDIKPRPPTPPTRAWPQKTRPRWLQGGQLLPSLLVASTTTLTPLPTAPGPVPPVRIESSSSTVAEGQTLDLNCVVAGQAHAQVTWYKRGGSLPARHQVHNSSRKVGEGQLG